MPITVSNYNKHEDRLVESIQYESYEEWCKYHPSLSRMNSGDFFYGHHEKNVSECSWIVTYIFCTDPDNVGISRCRYVATGEKDSLAMIGRICKRYPELEDPTTKSIALMRGKHGW